MDYKEGLGVDVRHMLCRERLYEDNEIARRRP